MANETVIINGVTISDTESIDRYVEIENDTALLAGKGDESGNYLEGSSGMVKYTDLKRKMLEGVPNKDYVDQELQKKVDKADQTQKDAEQDAQINLKANKADSRLLNLRADNLSFTLDENRLPSPLNQSIKVHVDKNNIDGDVVITGKDVAPNTMDFEVTPEDMAKDGVVLKNVLPVSQKWSSGGKITVEYVEELKKCTITTTEVNPNVSFYTNDIVAKNEPYFYRMRIKNTSSKTHKFKILGNTILFPLTEKNIESGATETLSCIAVWTSGDYPQFTLRVLDSEQGATFEFTSEIINMAELSARYPNLSDEELKTILDSSLPYISAQGELELGNVIQIENLVPNPTSTDGWRAEQNVTNFTKANGIVTGTTGNYSSTFRNWILITPNNLVDKNNYFCRINSIASTASYRIGLGWSGSLAINNNYGILTYSLPNTQYLSIGAGTELSTITFDTKDGVEIVDLSTSLLDLWLSLNGYTTDEQKAKWCNEHIPFFEGTYPLWVGAIKDEHTVTATCGEYSSSLTFKPVLQKESIATQPYVDNALRDKADVITNTFRGATPFLRTDTDEEPLLGMTIYGKTEQFSTEGNQLIPDSEINRQPTLIKAFGKNGYALTPNQSYTFSTSRNVSHMAISDYTTDSNYVVDTNTNHVTYTPQSAVTITLTVWGETDTSDIKIQLQKGSSPLPFEPYTGGKPSPSPDYPQEIKTAGASGSIETRVQGKNLLDPSERYKDDNNIRYFKDSGFAFHKGVSYTLSCNQTMGQISFYEKTEPLKPALKLVYSQSTLTYVPDRDFIGLVAFYKPNIPDDIDAQLEVGSIATSYEPFKPVQTATATTPNGLTKWDRIEERDGVWGIVKKGLRLQITSALNMLYDDYGGNNPIIHITISNKMADINAVDKFSNRFIYNPRMLSSYKEGTFGTKDVTGDTGMFCFAPPSGITSVELFKTWLTSHPTYIEYETGTETFIPLSAEEQAQFASLKTYNPNTTISNDDGTEVYIKYRAETSRIVEQMARTIVKNEAIYEMGENYIKYGNGVMECWGSVAKTGTWMARGTGFMANCDVNISFPFPFVQKPIVTPSSDSTSAMYCSIANINCSEIAINKIAVFDFITHQPTDTIIMNWHAIGKWK